MSETNYKRANPKEDEFSVRQKPFPLFLIGAACLVALVLLISGKVHAADLTISYTAPTTCAGGEALVNCPTTGFEISKGSSATGTFAVVETVAPTVLSKKYLNLTPGTYCYSAKTVSNSLKSAESNRACADIPFLPPKAPQGMTIKIELTVTQEP